MCGVNRYFDLRGTAALDTFQRMNFGERVKAACTHAGFSQQELAERVGMRQPSLNYLEDPKKNAQGSEFTVRIARACGVDVDWLSEGEGEMLPLVYSTRDTQIIEAMRAMEKLSEGWKTFAVKNIEGIADNAKPGAGNGTDG